MNRYIVLLVFIIISCKVDSQCLVTSLIINTGYDPVTGLAIPGGANGAPAVTDPHWKVAAVSPGIATAISVTPISGLIEVIPGNSADVIIPAYHWTDNPLGNPGNWISCLNSNTYNTDGTGPTGTAYNMTLGRPFRMCSADSITLSFNIANDNYISSTNIDGIPLSFSQPADTPLSNFEMYTYFTQTVYLIAGIHTVNIEVNNYNPIGIRVNPTGLNIYGTISSATGTSSLVSETDPSCSSYVCGGIAPLYCDSIALPDTLHECGEVPITLSAMLYGSDSVANIAWTPAAGISNPAILDPTLSTALPGWYYLTVESIIPDNLIANGDFSAGNDSFLSPDYTYLPTVPYSNEYTISTDVFLADPGIGVHFYDHSDPPVGNMMVVNGGSPAANTVAWQEIITVTAGSDYIFGAWYAYWTYDISGLSNPQLLVKITPVGSIDSSTNNFAALTSACNWHNETYVWTAPAGATSVIVQIIDQNSSYYYNDFCLDDISFQQLCTTKDSVYIDINTPGTTYGHKDTSICSLVASITLNAPVGYSSYTWNTGATTPFVTAGSGIYWVDASVSCTSFIDTFYVTSTPAAITTSAKDTSVCEGNSIALNAPGEYSSFLWNTGSVANSITEGPGTYWVSASVICAVLTDTFYVASIPSPIVSLGNDTSICEGASITLNSFQPTGSQYLWSNGSTGSSIAISSSGTYTLTVTQNGCSASSSVSISELNKPSPINLGPDTTLCNGDQFVLSLNDSDGSLLWSTGNTDQNITVAENGNYWVTASNVCGSASDTIDVNFELCDISFPSAFTPNGDGLNDIIRAVGNLQLYRDFALSIYNRWGQRVFYTEDIYDGWNGKFNGVNQDVGTYYYMMYYSLEGKKHMMKGDLELIR